MPGPVGCGEQGAQAPAASRPTNNKKHEDTPGPLRAEPGHCLSRQTVTPRRGARAERSPADQPWGPPAGERASTACPEDGAVSHLDVSKTARAWDKLGALGQQRDAGGACPWVSSCGDASCLQVSGRSTCSRAASVFSGGDGGQPQGSVWTTMGTGDRGAACAERPACGAPGGPSGLLRPGGQQRSLSLDPSRSGAQHHQHGGSDATGLGNEPTQEGPAELPQLSSYHAVESPSSPPPV